MSGLKRINKVVVFKDGYAQVILCDDVTPYVGRPDAFINPNLSQVSHVSPEFWEIRNGTIAVIEEEGRAARRATCKAVSKEITTTADGIAWMRQMEMDMEALKNDTTLRLAAMQDKLESELAIAHSRTVQIVEQMGSMQVGATRYFTDVLVSLQKDQEVKWSKNKRNLFITAILSLVLMGIAGGILYGR